MSVGERIKEERERLEFNQDSFAEMAGVSRRSQIMYEQDKTDASAGYFTKIAEIGADVNYILTGKRTIEEVAKKEAANDELSERNRWLISIFNKLAPEDQDDAVKEIKKIAENREIRRELMQVRQEVRQLARSAA